jgi:hypothetical protein
MYAAKQIIVLYPGIFFDEWSLLFSISEIQNTIACRNWL